MTELTPYRKEAYWISPDGTILKVRTTHIAEIIDDSSFFGLEKEKIKTLYKAYNEPLGHEGKARGKIMQDLILTGWIRIRWKPRNHHYTVQMIKSDATEVNFNRWLEKLDFKPQLDFKFIEGSA